MTSRPEETRQCSSRVPAWLPSARAALLEHYDRTARPLPWRRDRDPYRVWVSEVMLQQTRVDTVIPYYERWLQRFPDIESLATAPEDRILKAWEGLGYYRRARHLHRAARVVKEDLGGALPRSYADLRRLPGLGEYTAGAVASIAFGEAVPAVDGNVRRVLARLFDVAHPAPAWLRKRAQALVDPARPGDWNQALMELGATLCTPRKPRCGSCPLEAFCEARQAGTQERRPEPARTRAVPAARFAVLVLVDRRGRAYLERRPPDGLLGGLWAFPEIHMETKEGEREKRAVAEAMEKIRNRVVSQSLHGPAALEVVKHRFTHLEARYEPYVLLVERAPGAAAGGGNEGRWEPLAGPSVALPAAQRKIAAGALRWLENGNQEVETS
ncbi:MAG: A/G-specific adenine glycosylase [Gemmatimonadota bacterium]